MRTIGKVEIALVLDNTGSMRGQKLTNLKDAATKLVDTLVLDHQGPQRPQDRPGAVLETVNVGPSYQTADWIDKDGISDAKNEVFNKKVNRFDLFDKQNVQAGAAASRAASMPYDIDEVTGDPSKPDTLYVPYFAPDEPDTKSGGKDVYTNNYLTDTPLATIKEGDAAAPVLPGLPAAPGRYRQVQRRRHQDRHQSGGMGYKYGPNCRLRDRAARPPLLRYRDVEDGDQRHDRQRQHRHPVRSRRGAGTCCRRSARSPTACPMTTRSGRNTSC